MKRYSTKSIMEKLQIEPIGYRFPPIKLANEMKKCDNTKYWDIQMLNYCL